jgi:uncharacterized protein YxeA
MRNVLFSASLLFLIVLLLLSCSSDKEEGDGFPCSLCENDDIIDNNTILISNPDPPTGVVSSTNSTSSITIGWGIVSGATGYYIYRSESTTGVYVQVGSSTTTSYTDDNLSSGTTYYYRVAGYNSGGTGSQSSFVSATTLPDVPYYLYTTVNSTSSITVEWNAVSGATSYRIYRSESFYGTYTQVGTSSTTSYTNIGLTAGTTYYYKITAYNNGGESEQSSNVSETTHPSAPTNLMATANSAYDITISWSSVSSATEYYIYRSTTSSSAYTLVGISTSTSYTDDYGLEANTRYYYRVAAYNSSGEGPQSTSSVSAITQSR